MRGERALKVALVSVGLLFSAGGAYALAMSLWRADQSEPSFAMMMGVYFALGVFLLIAVRKPSANRSLIAFTAWSSFAHAAVMAVQSLHNASERTGLLGAAAFFVIVGVILISLQSRELKTSQAQSISGHSTTTGA